MQQTSDAVEFCRRRTEAARHTESKMEADQERREKAYTFIAYSAITFSLVAIFSVCVTLPMVYNYVNHVQYNVRHETRDCKASVKDVMMEISAYRTGVIEALPAANHTMVKRQAGCDNCCRPGAGGPKGRPGKNGRPGIPGQPGSPGYPGRAGRELCSKPDPTCKICPKGQPGGPGTPGGPGNNGAPGNLGRDGSPGQQGNSGPPGPPGPDGPPGNAGPRGPPGRSAISVPSTPGDSGTPGLQGPPGAPGDRGLPGRDGGPGSPGPRGQPGQPGNPGSAGTPGEPGPKGPPGPTGERGVCPVYCADDGGAFFEDGTRK